MIDHYAAVISDLARRRNELDDIIAFLKTMQLEDCQRTITARPSPTGKDVSSLRDGCLRIVRERGGVHGLSSHEIVEIMLSDGASFDDLDFPNPNRSVSMILNRLAKKGEVVHDNGVWHLSRHTDEAKILKQPKT